MSIRPESKLPWIPDIQLIELLESHMKFCYLKEISEKDFWDVHEEAFQEIHGDQIKKLKDRIK